MNVLGDVHDRLLKSKTSNDQKRRKNRQNMNCAAEFRKDVTESPGVPLLPLATATRVLVMVAKGVRVDSLPTTVGIALPSHGRKE